MIDGVFLKQLELHPDERGFFEEILRKTDHFFSEGFGQLSHSHMVEGVVKAWHIHNTQVDWWYVVSGTIKAALCDLREKSPTHKELNEFILGDNKRQVLKIPAGVAHGLKVLSNFADLVYVTSGTYDIREEGRIPYNDSSIEYDWVQGTPIFNKIVT